MNAFKKTLVAIAAAATLGATCLAATQASAHGYGFRGYSSYGSYGYSYPSYGYSFPSYSYGYDYPSYSYGYGGYGHYGHRSW